MSKGRFKKGDPVYVIGGPGSLGSCVTGLYGYVMHVVTKRDKPAPEDIKRPYQVKVFSNPDKPAREGEFASDWTKVFSVGDREIVPLSQETTPGFAWRMERVKTLIKNDSKPDPEFDKVMRGIFRRVEKDNLAQKARDKQVEEASVKMGDVFPDKAFLKRGDKSNFSSFYDPVPVAANKEMMIYASQESRNLTVEQMARWAQARNVVDRASLFSSRQECRDVVKEFDLDPFIEEFNCALRHKQEHLVVPNGKLRVAVMLLWNRSFDIMQISDIKGSSCCGPDEGPTGFVVYYAKRREIKIEHLILDKLEDFIPDGR